MGDSGIGDKLTGGLFADPDSGAPPATASQSMEEQMKIYLQYLPQIQAAQLQAAQQNQPGYNQLNFEQLQKYGMPTAGIQQQIANSNAMAGAATNRDLLSGAGGQAAVNAVALNKLLNPEYYSVMQNAGRQTNNLLNSINLGGLSAGEQNAVERSLNQSNQGSGNLGNMNPTNTISAAMNFGGAFNSKLGTMGNALAAATNFANTAATGGGVNPVGVALGSSQTNQGNVGNFTNPNFSTENVGQSLLGGINQSANQQNQLKDAFNKYSSDQNKLDSWAGNIGGICCFIFLESYNGTLPEYVRYWRDYYYEHQPEVATGYKKMAKWLVPKMRSSKVVAKLVNYLMVKPITYYGAWKSGISLFGFVAYPVKAAWFLIWRKYGSV